VNAASDIYTLAERFGAALLRAGLELVTVESCTGGGLAAAVTAVPGASQWFERGLVTYSNDAKRELAGVSEDALEHNGAVSEAVAVEMAEGARGGQELLAEGGQEHRIAIAITGTAGPDGGTAAKPVGTVCMAWAGPWGTRAETVLFQGGRDEVRRQSVVFALAEALRLVEG